jgi:hypothetical protein
MKGMLNIGARPKGKPFSLELDAALQKFAILGISGSGKSCTASVMAEEMCKSGLPWIALDPVSVWWGLRATKDGTPSGYPVVVFGGDHADLPLEKGSGAKIAEALVSENVFAVIDLSLESKKFWHTWVTDFALTLMQLNPKVQRHIFVEEAPEFVPQRTKVDLTARCKEALERLIRLGRNRGYGYTLISQRPATIDKDALSQTENLFVLRTVGAHDRKALSEWLNIHNRADNGFLDDIQGLENGEGYFWSPQWMKDFVKVKVRERETFHPGETRKVGKAQKAVDLCDVREFVEKIRPQLTKTVVAVKANGPEGMEDVAVEMMLDRKIEKAIPSVPMVEKSKLDEALQENSKLGSRLMEASRKANDAARKIETVRKLLSPQYEALKALFGEIEASETVAENEEVYTPWLQKAGNGKRRKMLEVVIQRKEVTRAQLSTLSGTSINSSGFKNSLSWMKVNQLVDVEGDVVRLKAV